jgi:hypothetical protein
MSTMGVRAASAAAAAVLFACAREPEAFVCPDIGAGDLVITELRGSGGSWGQWIELHNATDEPIDLRGVQLLMQRRSGGDLVRIVVRADALPVEGGGFAVLGHHEPDEVPDFIDYTFFGDFFATAEDDPTPLQPRDLYRSGVLQVMACGIEIDRVVYPTLPDEGTWALDGSIAVDAEVNDDPLYWCADDFDPGTGIGPPGTPGANNRACDE